MVDQSQPDGRTSLAPYFKQFALYYCLTTLVTVAIVSLLQFEMPSSMGIIILMAAASGPFVSFVHATKRAPTKGERARFATGATIIATLLSMIFFVGGAYVMGGVDLLHYFAGLAQKLWTDEPPLAAALPFIALFVSWVVIYFTSGFYTKQVLKNLAAKA
jgi:heme/copper-type cytochrome/quinol oxidase subunit 4